MSRRSKRHSKAGMDTFRLQASARRAARGGRHDEAETAALAALRLTVRARRLAAAADIGSRKPSGVVLLDPKGFSPSGIPNRFRNMERLRRAGLPLDTPYKG